MIPYILAAIGGYFIGDATQSKKKTFADGGGVLDDLTGGIPFGKESGKDYDKITITEPLPDEVINRMIAKFRKAGWDAKPNNAGGITAVKKKYFVSDSKELFDGGVLDDLKNQGVKKELIRQAFFAGGNNGSKAAARKDFDTYEEWLKKHKIKHHIIYKKAFQDGGKAGFNLMKGRDAETFEEWQKKIEKEWNGKFADGGETTGEYAVRVYGNDQETDSVMSWVYDVEADSEDEAIRKAEEMFNYEWGLSGIDFVKAKVMRMEEIPVYEDGGQPGKFTFKTRDEYEAKTTKSGYFDYDTVEVEALNKDGITLYFQPKSEDEYKRISEAYQVVSVKPVMSWYDRADYEERDEEYYQSENEDDDDDYAKGGRVKFRDKVESIADRLQGTKVPKRLKKDYGARYDRAEAEEAGQRIAGAQLKKLKEKPLKSKKKR